MYRSHLELSVLVQRGPGSQLSRHMEQNLAGSDDRCSVFSWRIALQLCIGQRAEKTRSH